MGFVFYDGLTLHSDFVYNEFELRSGLTTKFKNIFNYASGRSAVVSQLATKLRDGGVFFDERSRLRRTLVTS